MEPKELLKKYMEGEILTVEENEELNNWVVAYLDSDEPEQQTLQGQFFYEEDGETKVITHDHLVAIFWEFTMSFDGEYVPAPSRIRSEHIIYRWGWLFALLTGLMSAAVVTFLNKCNH